jgi:uncharacterized repeat protein (TIGR03803 family)
MYPQSSLIFGASGNLYGTTEQGGTVGAGTVFELTPTSSGWNETVLYSFQAGSDGIYPNSNLAIDAAGNLYGTTLLGGAGDCNGNGCGIVFQLTPPTDGGSWTESVVYSFQGGIDGAYPYGVIMDRSGSLYGATGQGGFTECGGGFGCGTVFELSSSSGNWAETILYSFKGGPQDGGNPESGLAMDSNGNLFGATYFGGGSSLGTIYELSPSNGTWTENILFAFTGNGGNGHNPSSTLVFSSQGYLVGTAQGGNPSGCCGEVFALVPHSGGNWSEIAVFRFNTKDGEVGSPDGSGTPVFDTHGNLYGTAGGGQYNEGVAYRLKLGAHGVTEAYYSFCPKAGCHTGSDPQGGLILDGSGNLYGTTSSGGLGYGVVYEITP